MKTARPHRSALRQASPELVGGANRRDHAHDEQAPSADNAGPRRGGVRVRPFAPADLPGVFRLYREVFGPEREAAFRRRWRWSQEENLAPGDTPRWVLTAGDEVVGFLGTSPQPYLIGGERVVAHASCDYMTHPSYRFHGISLMKAFFQTCPASVSCDDMEATIRVTEWLGAEATGRMVRWVRPLDGRALATVGGWRKAPSPARGAAVAALDLAARLRTVAERRSVKVERVDGFDARFDAFFWEHASRVPATPVRDAAFLSWRYGPESPHAARGIAVAPAPDGSLLGYVVFHGPVGPERAGYILDLQTPPEAGDGRSAAPALLHTAVEAMAASGCWRVYYPHLATPHTPPVEVLRRQGFTPRGSHTLLVWLRDGRLNDVARAPEGWSLSYGDTEASHALA